MAREAITLLFASANLFPVPENLSPQRQQSVVSFAPLLVLLCSRPSCMTSLTNPVPQRPQLSQLAYRHLLASVFQQVHSSV